MKHSRRQRKKIKGGAFLIKGVEDVGKGVGKGIYDVGKGVGKGVYNVGEGVGKGVYGVGKGVVHSVKKINPFAHSRKNKRSRKYRTKN
jgi:hypothetical protein